jgi:hypothetical protein
MRTSHRLAPAAAIVCLSLAAVIALSAAADIRPPADNRELHVIGIYEGVTKTGDEIHGGRAFVKVDRPGRRVTLVLSSYESVTWEVTLTPKTSLEKVIVGGHDPQAVKILPPGAEVVRAFRGSGARPTLSYFGYNVDSARFRFLVEHLRHWTDLEIASFQGTYAYKHGSPFIVDQVQDDPRLSRSYPKLTPLADLPDLRFQALHLAGDVQRGLGTRASLGDFTLAGQQMQTLKPLPGEVRRLAFDPANNKYYGLALHDVCEVDLAKQTTKEMDVGLDVPKLSWPADLTYDTKRARLLVVTGGGGGYLYAHDTATGAWSVLAEKLGVGSLVYHPKQDCLYGIAVHHDEDGGKPVLRQFNHQGALVKETPLGDHVVPGTLHGGPGTNGTQLVAVNDFLVILAAPQGLGASEHAAPSRKYIYLIDLKAGKTWVTSKDPA